MPPHHCHPGWAMGVRQALKQGLWSSCVYQVVIQAWCCGGPQGWRSKQVRHGPMELGGSVFANIFHIRWWSICLTLGRI